MQCYNTQHETKDGYILIDDMANIHLINTINYIYNQRKKHGVSNDEWKAYIAGSMTRYVLELSYRSLFRQVSETILWQVEEALKFFFSYNSKEHGRFSVPVLSAPFDPSFLPKNRGEYTGDSVNTESEWGRPEDDWGMIYSDPQYD